MAQFGPIAQKQYDFNPLSGLMGNITTPQFATKSEGGKFVLKDGSTTTPTNFTKFTPNIKNSNAILSKVGPIAPKEPIQSPFLPNFAEQTTKQFTEGLKPTEPKPQPKPGIFDKISETIFPKVSAMSEQELSDNINAGMYDDTIQQLSDEGYAIEDIEKALRDELITTEIPGEMKEESMSDKFKIKSSESFAPTELGKDVLKFFANVPADSAEVLGGLWDAVTSPIETTKGVVKTAKGLSDTAVYGIANAISRSLGGKEVPATEEMQMIQSIGDHIKENYGTAGKFKKAIVENPTDTLLTLMGGLGTASKVAKSKGFVDVANKIDKVQKVINPVNILKQEAKIITKPIGLTGTAIKKTGESLYKTAIKPTSQEAEKILKFKAGLGEKPTTVADTALKSGVAGTETRIGVQGLKKANEIFNKKVNPIMEKTTTQHSLSDLFSKAEEKINSMKGELRKSDLKEGLEALKEDYNKLGKNKFSTKELDMEKSSLDEFTPDKVFKGKQVANTYNQAKNILANVFRDSVHKDLGKFGLNSAEAYRDYANLKELSKFGIKGLTEGGLKGGLKGGFWTTIYEQATTPIKTIGGQVLYKVGDKLEFLGPKGIDKFGDYIKGKINVGKNGILSSNQIKKGQ